MFGKFLPQTTNFFEFFESHIVIDHKAVQELLILISQSYSEQILHARNVTELEKEADEVTHQCIDALHKTFITPFERNDIYRLITSLDDIIDAIEDVARRIIIYKLNPTTRDIGQLVHILDAAVLEIQKALMALHKKEASDSVHKTLMHIHKLENDADAIVEREIGLLFDEEKDPILLIKWKEIFEFLEEAVDCCEKVANIVEGVMIENS